MPSQEDIETAKVIARNFLRENNETAAINVYKTRVMVDRKEAERVIAELSRELKREVLHQPTTSNMYRAEFTGETVDQAVLNGFFALNLTTAELIGSSRIEVYEEPLQDGSRKVGISIPMNLPHDDVLQTRITEQPTKATFKPLARANGTQPTLFAPPVEERYEALKTLSVIYRATAWFIGISAILMAISLFSERQGTAGIVVGIWGILGALGLLAASDIFLILISMEHNTRDTNRTAKRISNSIDNLMQHIVLSIRPH
jgi:hypothetical protein